MTLKKARLREIVDNSNSLHSQTERKRPAALVLSQKNFKHTLKAESVAKHNYQKSEHTRNKILKAKSPRADALNEPDTATT